MHAQPLPPQHMAHLLHGSHVLEGIPITTSHGPIGYTHGSGHFSAHEGVNSERVCFSLAFTGVVLDLAAAGHVLSELLRFRLGLGCDLVGCVCVWDVGALGRSRQIRNTLGTPWDPSGGLWGHFNDVWGLIGGDMSI